MTAWLPFSLCVSALFLFASLEAAPSSFEDDSAEARPYEGYQVFSVEAKTAEQVHVLSELTERPGVDFWSFRPEILEENVLSVSPDALEEVITSLTGGFHVKRLIENLQESVDRERAELDATRASFDSSDSDPDYTRYLRYNEIIDYARVLEKRHPGRVGVKSLGKTVEGRDLYVITVSECQNCRKFEGTHAVFVDAGIHAREWIAPATALYLLDQLVANHTNDLTTGLDWFIVPVLNPDGYEYTHTDKRLWRKNRRKGTNCPGVDLNRNFDFHWNEAGGSSNQCSEIYSGPSAASEPEVQAVSKFLVEHKSDIVMYLSLHSYGNYLLYPWGFTSDLPKDWKELDDIAKLANKAMVKAGSKSYTIGSSTNVLYAAAGCSDDYAKGVAGVAKSYTIELPGGGPNGFDMPPSKIKQTVTQVFEGLRVFGLEATKIP